MAKKSKAGAKTTIKQQQKLQAATIKKKRNKIKRAGGFILGIAVLFGVSAAGVNAYKKSWAESHDLSVIGNGNPTVVQIHDPNCPKCKQLMSNTKVALKQFGDRIQYKIADIKTSAGKRLQNEHGVQHVTLLMFDGRGELKRATNGVKSVDILETEFTDFLKRVER